MSTLDIILGGLLILGIINGWNKGLIVEVVSIISYIIGFFLALHLSFPVTVYLLDGFPGINLLSIVVFVGLFIVIALLTKTLGKLLRNIVHMSFLGVFDQLGGSIFGLLKWTLIISIFLWVAASTQLFVMKPDDSIFYPYLYGLAPNIFAWLGDYFGFIQELIDAMQDMSKQKDIYLTISSEP